MYIDKMVEMRNFSNDDFLTVREELDINIAVMVRYLLSL